MLRLFLLGTPQITLDEQPITGFRSAKALALLVYLAATGQAHTRHALAGLLWGDDADESAKNSLRVTLANLKKILPGAFDASRLSIRLNPAMPVWLDVDELAQSLARLGSGKLNDLRKAANLCRGEFLDGFTVDAAPDFVEWLASQRRHWRQQSTGALDALADALLAQDLYDEALEVLPRLLQLEPWAESTHRRLMLVYARRGQFEAVRRQYHACQQVLADRLNVKPTPETTALYTQLVAAQDGRNAAALPADDTPFLGRAAELAQIAELLANPQCRLLSIVGLGGIGKTRLALAAARRLAADTHRRFIHGVCFVSLVSVDDGERLPQMLSDLLSLSSSGRMSPMAQVLEHLRDKEMLLVLDNFEQIADTAHRLGEIIQRCPQVKLLVTSREPLLLAGEWRLDLAGFTAPRHLHTVSEAMNYEAIQFFVQTVAQTAADYDLIEADLPHVCRLVQVTGGSPLAIKLAALHLSTTSLAQLVAGIEHNLDLLAVADPGWQPRQRSLRAIFDYTYNLLTPPEQAVFRRLAIFRGGFSAEAAEDVAGASSPTLAALFDRGLLQWGASSPVLRYSLHELLRHYAASLMTAAEADRVCTRHATYFADLAHRHADNLYSPRYKLAVEMATTEEDNLWAAWRWLLTRLHSGDDAASLFVAIDQLVPTLASVFDFRAAFQTAQGFLSEGIAALAAALAVSEVEESRCKLQTALARLQTWSIVFQSVLSKHEAVDHLSPQVLPVLRNAGDDEGVARLLTAWGRSFLRRGLHTRATNLLTESLDLYRRLASEAGIAEALISLGMVASGIGEYVQARRFYGEALAVADRINYEPLIARIYLNWGTTYARQFDYPNALPFYQKSLALAETTGDVQLIMVNTSNIGGAQRGFRRYDLAEAYYKRSLDMAREMADRRWVAVNLIGLGMTYLEVDDLAAADNVLQRSMGVAHGIRSNPDTLGSLSLLAHVWARQGKIDAALRGLLFTDRHPAQMDQYRRYSAPLLQDLLEELPKEVIHAVQAWQETTSLDDVVSWGSQLTASQGTIAY